MKSKLSALHTVRRKVVTLVIELQCTEFSNIKIVYLLIFFLFFISVVAFNVSLFLFSEIFHGTI